MLLIVYYGDEPGLQHNRIFSATISVFGIFYKKNGGDVRNRMQKVGGAKIALSARRQSVADRRGCFSGHRSVQMAVHVHRRPDALVT